MRDTEGKGRQVTFIDETTAPNGRLALVVGAVLAPGPPDAGTPSPGAAAVAARFAPSGVPTSDRVGASPVLTSRRGVYTTAPVTLTPTSASLGGAAAVTAALADLARGFPEAEGVASVDGEECAACLNCLRMCPHDAIVFDDQARAAKVLRRACQACGMCRGVCPAQAITLGAVPTEGGAPRA
jgi:heterodisulfide reductase subunit A-like polyferredoxin